MRQSNHDEGAKRGPGEIQKWIVPAYVFMCLMIGGSPQGVGFTLILTLSALVLLAWALFVERVEPPVRGELGLWVLIGLAALLVVAQLAPLPPAIWTHFPWRSTIAEGDQLLGLGSQWRAWSLSPDDTIATALAVLPPIAVVVAIVRARAFRPDLLIMAILAATVL